MKQKFILSFVVIVFGVLFASAQNEEKLTVNAGSVEHVQIASDLNIVLMPSQETDNSISMDAATLGKLDVQLVGTTLTISSINPVANEKRTVFVYVSNLKTLTVESNSTVKTIGVLNTPKLDVFVGSHSNVHVKTNGEVNPHGTDNREIKVKYLSQNWLAKGNSRTAKR